MANIVTGDVVHRPAFARGVDGDPAIGIAIAVGVAPDRDRLAGIGHHPANIAIFATGRSSTDLHVIDGIVELAISATDAPRPAFVKALLEAQDQLILIDRIHVAINFRAQIADRAVALGVVDISDLRPEDRHRILRAVAVDQVIAAEGIVSAFIKQPAGLLDVDHVGHGQIIATEIAEQLHVAVAVHVPGKAEAWRNHVVHLDVTRTAAILVVEAVRAQPDIEQKVRRDRPVVLNIGCGERRLERARDLVAPGPHIAGITRRHDPSVGDGCPCRCRVDVVEDAAGSRIVAIVIGRVLLVVKPKAQQMITEVPVEIDACGFAIVVACLDLAAGRAAERNAGVWNCVDRSDPVALDIAQRAGERLAVVFAVHHLHR